MKINNTDIINNIGINPQDNNTKKTKKENNSIFDFDQNKDNKMSKSEQKDYIMANLDKNLAKIAQTKKIDLNKLIDKMLNNAQTLELKAESEATIMLELWTDKANNLIQEELLKHQ